METENRACLAWPGNKGSLGKFRRVRLGQVTYNGTSNALRVKGGANINHGETIAIN